MPIFLANLLLFSFIISSDASSGNGKRFYLTTLNGRPIEVVEEEQAVFRDETGKSLLLTRRRSRQKMQIGPRTMSSISREERVENAADLSPVSLFISKKENGVRMELKVTIDGGVARVEGSSGKMAISLPEDKPVLFRLDGEVLHARNLLKKGGRLEAAVIVPEEGGVAFMEAAVVEQTPSGFLIKITNLIGSERPFWFEKVDNEGHLLEFQIGGMKKKLVPQAEARLPLLPARISNRVRAADAPSGLQRMGQVFLKLEGDIPSGIALIPESPYCKVVERGPGGFVLKLTATYPDGRLASSSLSREERREYLSRGILYEVGDPALQNALEEALSGPYPITAPLSKAVRICRWVHDRIRTAGGVPAMASALFAIRARRGDCTEYASALVGLLRQAGIPARMALGLVYDGTAFQFHAWGEAYVDDRWIPIDAAYKRVGFPPVYILLGYGDGESGVYENRAFRLLYGFSFRFLRNPPPEARSGGDIVPQTDIIR